MRIICLWLSVNLKAKVSKKHEMVFMAKISGFSMLVKDYDQALEWFCHSLNFEVIQDVPVGGDQRFVKVAPKDNAMFCLVLMLAQK